MPGIVIPIPERKQPKPKRLGNSGDFVIILLTFLLIAIGLLMVFDSSYFMAFRDPTVQESAHYFKRQLYGLALGCVAMLGFGLMDYRLLRRFVLPLLIAGYLLMFAVWFPGITYTANDATRWIKIGSVTVQTSELAKFSLIVYLAQLFTVKEKKMDCFGSTLLPALVITMGFCILLYLQPNISMLMTYVGGLAVMMWMAGARWKHLFLLILVAAVLLTVAYFFVPHVSVRLTSFINPEDDPRDTDYQLLQSLYAFANGGWTGVGFGNGIQKLQYLDYAETDFILAVIGEEFGLLGCVVLLVIYWLLLRRMTLVAIQCEDRFGKLLAGGITAMIFVQILIHVAVVTGSMPTTGLPLPFISYGGTSLAVFMGEVGVVLSISRSTGVHKRNMLVIRRKRGAASA